VKKGTIEVCKKVQGPDPGFDFKFVIKKDGKEVTSLYLRKNDCTKVKVDEGDYSVTEYVPKECEVTMIHIRGDGHSDVSKAAAWLAVKKGETVTVTFFDRCKRNDCK